MSQPVYSSLRSASLSFVAVCCIWLIAATQSHAQDFVIVAHPALGVNEVSADEIHQMLLGKKSTWSSGERVVFSLFSDAATQAAFLKEFAHKTPMQFKSYWKKRVFTGKGRMPMYFATPKEVAAYVKAHPGAFSFMPAPGDKTVKTLTIK